MRPRVIRRVWQVSDAPLCQWYRARVDSNALARFAVVAESESFADAARILGVSRQAVQRTVAGLEERYDVPLVVRDTRKLKLTDAGRRLAEVARRVRDASTAARELLEAASTAPVGRLRISVPPLCLERVVAPLLADFLREHPSVELELHGTASFDDLFSGFDCLIRVGGPVPDAPFARKLFGVRRAVVASPELAAAHPLRHPSDLEGLPSVHYGVSGHPWHFQGPTGPLALAKEHRLVVDNLQAVLPPVLAGHAFGNIPRIGIHANLVDGTLVEVLREWPAPEVTMWALYGHRTSKDPTLAAFLDRLAAVDWEAL